MLCAVTAYRLDNFTRRCLESLVAESSEPPHVSDNAPERSTLALADEFGATYASYGRRVHLAESWNRICEMAFNYEARRAVLILNNDTWNFRGLRVLEEKVDANIDRYGMFFGMQNPVRFYRPCPSWFSGFVITDWCFGEVGPFDEGFELMGYEDDDYMMRLAGKHIPTALVRAFSFTHYSASTMELNERERVASDRHNSDRFVEKWGIRRVDKESPDFRFPGMAEI